MIQRAAAHYSPAFLNHAWGSLPCSAYHVYTLLSPTFLNLNIAKTEIWV